MRSRILFAVLAVAGGARAGDPDALQRAMAELQGGQLRRAAIAFHAAARPDAPPIRAEASYHLARALERLGLDASALSYDEAILEGPAGPWSARAGEAAVLEAERLHDELLAPAALRRARPGTFDSVPQPVRARADAALALFALRSGRPEEAARLAERVAADGPLYARAQLVLGIAAQGTDPEKAIGAFRRVLRLGDEQRDAKDLAHLALGRTLYGARRFGEAAAEYAAVTRFSRHFGEALFEGAYAELRAGDAGAALGRLHSLRAPQLADAFEPEAENLLATIYHQHCLWPQVREALGRFDRTYSPMRSAVASFLATNPSTDALIGAAGAAGALPEPIRRHVRNNDRLEAMLRHLAALGAEAARISADAELRANALGPDLLERLAKRRAAVAQAAATLLRTQLSDVVRLLEGIDADQRMVRFETTRGEKDFLEQSVDAGKRLGAQTLRRPPMPQSGHEYWAFDGEYWPDEIGSYRYTIKNACTPANEPATASRAPARGQTASATADAARDEAIARKRDELIGDLQSVLPRIHDARRADLWFQLAELWWEKARFASLEEVREHDARYAAWLDARSRDEKAAGPEPRVSTARSGGFRREALAAYRRILQDHPGYARSDEVLFVAAYNQYEVGDRADAVRSYQSLIDRFPRSRFVPDAYVQLGEHWFAANDLARARAAFGKAASFRLPKLYAFSLYKLAWCDYNAGDYGAAIARFHEVVDYARREAHASGDRIQLAAEALKDVVLAYARIDAIEDAAAYFEEKAGAEAVGYLDRLGATYFDDGKFEQAVRVYRLLEAKAPLDARAPAWQQKIVLAYDKLNRRDHVLAETNRLVSEYGPAADWARANANRKAEAGELAESALRELVQDYHQEATKTNNPATYRLARAMYRRYLDAFPAAEAAYSVRFYYAEILYALDEWDAAGGEYARVADANPGGEHAKKAAYAAVLAAEKSVAGTKRQAAAAKDAGPQPMSDAEKRLVEACERYVRVAPGAQDEVAVRYRVALLYYEHRLHPEASARFADIVARWPADPWSQKAADLSLDILNAKEQWAELGELARRFHADERLAPRGSEFEKRVARIAEGAEFKHALDVYEKRNDPALAARKFRAFVEAHPSSEYAPVALNDCMVIAEAAGQLDVAMAAAAQLLREHPHADEALRKAALRSLASASARTARYADAARWSEEYAALWPADPKAPDMLFDAAVWREGLDDDARALADWRGWLKRSPAVADAPRIAFKVGLLLERIHDLRGAAAHWAAFQKTYARGAAPGQLLLARYREGLALRQLGRDPAAALAEVGRRFDTLGDAERTSAVVDAAAHARFLAVERPFAEFAAIQFRSARERDLVRALKRKNDGLGRLLQAYAAVIRTGSAVWSAAALTRLGEAYRDFNKGLLEAPAPKGLDAEQRNLYRSTLENQALPLEDKSVDAFAKAADIGLRTGVYSEWVLKAQEQLRAYRPDQVGEARAPALVHRLRKPARGER